MPLVPDMTAEWELPARPGGRPTTNRSMPHSQLDENSPPEVFEALASWLFTLPHVREDRSRVSLPSSRAAWITDDVPLADPLAEREFTHLHQEPGPGSQHLGLPIDDGQAVLAADRGEPHPLDGMRPDVRYLLIYAPRDADELEVVKTIVSRAYRWTVGSPERPAN
jgi:phospholipase/carboxylesterase